MFAECVEALGGVPWRAGSLGRRAVRRFLGRWLDGRLLTGPDAELRTSLVAKLARQGWTVRASDSVLIATEPVHGILSSSDFLQETRLHPTVEAEARPQFIIRKLDLARPGARARRARSRHAAVA